MARIKFSHNYHKVFGQTQAELLAVKLLDAKEVQANQALINYDTLYFTKHTDGSGKANYYPLPKSGKLVQLIFLGDQGIPFCTIRPQIGYLELDKYSYYRNKIGEMFNIIIQEGGGDNYVQEELL